MPDVTLGQHRIHYLDEGAGASAPLVLLHNGGMSGEVWRPQLEHFARTRRVIAPDMLGFGASDKPHLEYGLPTYVGMLDELLTALDLPPAVLVGNCIGAATALRLATAQPERVAAVVALNVDTDDTLAGGEFGTLLWLARLVPGMRRAFGWVTGRVRAPQRIVQRGAAKLFLGDPDPAFTALVRACYRDPANVRVLGSIFEHIDTYELVPPAPRDRRPPTCLVWGERNRVLPLAGMERVRDALEPDEAHVIAGASHLAARERPDEFNAIVETFLARHAR